ncbi:MAG: PSD1 domain-containing protein [Planctomycetales bacterium]|nr:PSD1 domain-containing protein [Planctomycetales bacterium]
MLRAWFAVTGVLVPLTLFAAEPAPTGETADFGRDIKPLLARRCFSCHGPDEAEGGLRLHESKSAQAELESGKRAVVPGAPDQSELLARVASKDESERMPPEGKPLTESEVAALRQWIAAGAEWKGHWAFEPVANPDPPRLQDEAQWAPHVATDIDRFVAAQLQARGLKPNRDADRRVLIRRAYYDLIGLPPSTAEIEAFVNDTQPDAWGRLIDRLLEMPQYGERWGRHWLDLVRYAETNSFERDGPKPNAWKYRDYVIRSLNEDKPYDRFLLEQLAGDELPDANLETMTATGFYRLGIWDDEPADPLLARYDELDDILTVTGQGLMGLTLNCARCHDHKIDPVTQSDYYGLIAFFQGLTPYGHRGDQTSNNQWDAAGPAVKSQRQQLEQQKKQLERESRELEQAGIAKMPAPDQRATEGPERAKVLRKKLKDHLDDQQWEQYEAKQAALREVSKQLAGLPAEEFVLAVAKCDPRPAATHVLPRGNPHAPAAEVSPHFPEILGGGSPSLPELAADARSSGRRLALARWITSPDNRLTARVMVNRVWQFHFGRGIVASSNNFGMLGTPPTHPELLDYLTTHFVKDGWSLKKLHKRIMLSAAYRRASSDNAEALAADPGNELLWRFDIRRLSAEELRDSMLQVTGELNRQMYGPSIYPKISQEVLAGQSRPGAGWGNSSPEQASRRSVYIHIKRSLIPPELSVFDFPETDRSCEARFVTIQPAQALTMLNSDFAQARAEKLAERCRAEAEDLAGQIRVAIDHVFSRAAEADEIRRYSELFERLRSQHEASPEAALKLICLALLNTNEFMFLD